MIFSLTEEQKMLRKSARDFLESECPPSLVKAMVEDEKGYSPQLWRKMAQLGWQGLTFPNQYGGGDGTFLDLVIILEEMGRALLPSPFFTTVILGGATILEAGSEEQKAELLPRVISGDTIFSLALTEPFTRYPSSSIAVRAVPQNGHYIINGTKLFIPMAHVADYLICVARTSDGVKPDDGITNFIVDAKSSGITYTPLKTIGCHKQYEVLFDNVVAPAKNILGEFDNGWVHISKVLQMATVAQCAEMNGGAQRVIEMTSNYAKDRVTFGHLLGSFQAIQHLCSDMLIALESSQVLTYEAAWKISQRLPCNLEVSMAKYKANECYMQAVHTGTQIQGGVSIITDHDMPLYYRHAKTTEITLGDADFHLDLIARELLD